MDQYQNNMNNSQNTQSGPQTGSGRPMPRPNGFEAFAVLLGIGSITVFCTGVFSIILGALGILFVCLAHRHGRKLSRSCRMALITSLLGMVAGIALTAYTLVNTVIPFLSDPAQREQLNSYYEETMGISLDEMFPFSID